MKAVFAIVRGLLRGLTWPFRGLFRFIGGVFARRGPVVGAVSVVGCICAVLLLWNLVVGPLLVKTMLAGMKAKPLAVDAAQVVSTTWRPAIEAVGSAKAFQGADLAMQVDGVVTKILFSAQSHVEAGQLLVQLDDSVEQADLIAAVANVKLAETALARASELRHKGVNAQSSLDDARNQLDVARSSQARLQALIDQKALKAPFAGTVGIAKVDVGQYVSKGTTLVTLQDLDKLYVDFTVPEQAVANVMLSQSAHFGVVSNALNYNGKVVGIDPKVDLQSRLVNVRAEITGATDRIVPGQFLRVRLDLQAEPNVIVLPSTAVVPSLYGDYVYVVAPLEGAQAKDAKTKKGIARQTIVKTGRRNGNLIEIREGLALGQWVVSSGQNTVQNGAEVEVTNGADAATLADGGSLP